MRQADPNEITEKLQQFYNWHPLMANVTTKAHEFFQHEGLTPFYFQVNNPQNTRKFQVKYMELDNLFHENPAENKTPVKSVLFKNNGLVLVLPRLLMLQIVQDNFSDNKIHLYLKKIGGMQGRHGTIPQLDPNQYSTGRFEERKLEMFLCRCLHEPLSYL